MTTITMLASVARNGVIGDYDGVSPELKPFVTLSEELTRGKTVIMGRKTFETYGAIPKDRHNIVLTRSKNPCFKGCSHADGIRNAIRLARDCSEEDILIIGGGDVFSQAWRVADKMIITRVQAEMRGAIKFPFYTDTEFHRIWSPMPTSANKPKEKRSWIPHMRVTYERVA